MSLPEPTISGFGQNRAEADLFGGIPQRRVILSSVLSVLPISSVCDYSKENQMSSKTTRLENLLEAVPDALVGMDQEGVIRFVNYQTESLFGYDRDDLVGQPIQTLVPAVSY